MSTTFAIKLTSGETKDVARRVGGKNGAEMWFTDPMAELLPDNTPVIAVDNSSQGIHTIGDIKQYCANQHNEESEEEEDYSYLEEDKVEFKQRKSLFVPLTDAWHKDHDFVEVTEWTNGEGWDIAISDQKQIALHFTEFDVIKRLIKILEDESYKK